MLSECHVAGKRQRVLIFNRALTECEVGKIIKSGVHMHANGWGCVWGGGSHVNKQI